MNDAFGKELKLNDKVVYSVKGGGGTEYAVGKIVKLLPHQESKAQFKVDKVEIEVTQTNRSIPFDSTTIVYACNVILIKALKC